MTSAAATIAVVNAGSSSLKVSLFRDETLLAKAAIDRLGSSDGQPHANLSVGKDVHFDEPISAKNSEDALAWVLDRLEELVPDASVTAYGHRVVHGGDRFVEPTRVTPEVVETLERYVPLAPLHLPHNLAPIRYLLEHCPEVPQVVCFDTAFHATQAQIERTYALPPEFFERGIKKYGFHGLSYEYIASVLPRIDARAAEGRTIVCHLGNGASMCAMQACKSVASSMGFTALEGIPMGTRSGSIDPGVLLYLLEEGMTQSDLTDLLYKKSGLLGMSGISSDMRDLLASSEANAAQAVDHFCYRIACEMGRLASTLEGLDALVFTGGIGEHAASIRERVCRRCLWLGVELALDENTQHATRIHTERSAVRVLVVPTNEELVIARHSLERT